MTVPASRIINNTLDVSRKIPSTALADRVLTAAEGRVVQALIGPGVAGTVELNEAALPGTTPIILAHDGAGAWEAGGIAPAALPVPVVPTHFTFVESNANGKAELTEVGGRDYSGSTLLVWYHPNQPEAVRGGQSSVVSTDI